MPPEILEHQLANEDGAPAAEESDEALDPPEELRGSREAGRSFAGSAHQYIRDYIALADQKAAFVFAASTGLLAFLYHKDVADQWTKPLGQWAGMDWVAFLAMFLLGVTALLAVVVVTPSLRGSAGGLLFWRAIAAKGSASVYAQEVLGRSHDELAEEILSHCYELSVVCDGKYRTLAWALRVGLAAAVFTVLHLLFG